MEIFTKEVTSLMIQEKDSHEKIETVMLVNENRSFSQIMNSAVASESHEVLMETQKSSLCSIELASTNDATSSEELSSNVQQKKSSSTNNRFKTWERVKRVIYTLANMIIFPSVRGQKKQQNTASTFMNGNLMPWTNALLPPVEGESKPVLVVDLDETMIHSRVFTCPQPYLEENSKQEMFYFTVKTFFNSLHCYTYVRPHLRVFLESIKDHFECVLFTASTEVYARVIINKLELDKTFHHFLFNQHCDMVNGRITKNLLRLGRSMDKILIIDNSPMSYVLNTSNGVPIYSWYGEDMEDKELKKLIPFLSAASKSENLPVYFKDNYQNFLL